MRSYTLVVSPSIPLRDLTVDDRAVVGTYLATLHEGHWTEPQAVAAVLDEFHASFGLENVDDVIVAVYDAEGQEVSEEEDTVSPGEGLADLEKISEATNKPRRRKP